EYGMPFLGTCAGFQHAILEFGRNVLDIRDAASEEYTIAGAPLFISRLSCSLIGNLMPVRLEAGSRARDAYGSDHAVERYYCNFGLNSRWEPQLTSAGLLIKGRDSDGDARIIELRSHPFFVATLFVAQTSSAINSPHPLIRTFAVTAEERAAT
ncbi:MAG: CTP synthase, partial [Bryobacteraceae bacterium]